MATKVLGTKLEYNDLQYLLGLAKDAEQRRVIKSLFGYQLKMIEQNGLYGIDNCKQLHHTWLGWITSGCKSEDIVSRRYHHGFKAKLQYAQRLYTRYVQEDDLKSAENWLNIVTTVLRSYQVCGPSKDDMQNMWNDSIKENITRPLDRNVLIALLRGCLGISSRYNEPCTAQYVYELGCTIRSYFDMIEKVPRDNRTGFYRTLSEFVPNLELEDYCLLVKRGPHKVKVDNTEETVISIFGEGLDVHALKDHHPDCFIVDDEEVGPDLTGIPERQVFVIDKSKDLLQITNDLSEALLSSYKTSEVKPKHRDLSLSFTPQIPVGEVPADMSAAPGRTVLLADKAGKTRPISIATYTVNHALAPLHEQLFELLRRIRQDATDQQKGIDHILELTKQSGAFICSADLSSATDRLPVNLQAYILYRVLKLSGQNEAIKIANSWYQLMTGTPFLDPCDPTSYFRYGAGQPMGVYTSWPMLALTNHIMIRAAYWKCHDKSLDYLVCGDDTVIASKKPFQCYEDWMNSLGVMINRSKSHICEADDPIKVAEFCKRLAVNGKIVSSESPKILIRASRDRAYQPAALECIHSMCGPISNKKFANLVDVHRIGKRKLHIPYRYGGWGQIDNRPFHQVMLEDNFIFVYIYKKMRGMISARETMVSKDGPGDQKSIDSLSRYATDNPYRHAEKDWRLMGQKAYTPIKTCIGYLEPYENFLIGLNKNLTPSQIVELVKETFDLLDKCPIPVRLLSKDNIDSKSKFALDAQRMLTRTLRNLQHQQIQVFCKMQVQNIDISINWAEESQLLDPKDLVEALDEIMFT